MKAHIYTKPIEFRGGVEPLPGRLYYLAHPFKTCQGKNTSEAEQAANVRYAAHIEELLLRRGVRVINPLLLPLGREIGPDGAVVINDKAAREDCIRLLNVCTGGIILAPKWEDSTGCCDERKTAVAWGFDVFEIIACM